MTTTGADGGIGGWTPGPIVGRRPAGVARDAVHAGRGARGVLVLVDDRFTDPAPPDAEAVARASLVGAPSVVPMLDAGLLEDGTRWYVTPSIQAPVLDPAAGCSPRRAVTIGEGVARSLAAVHEAGLVHGLVGPQSVVPASGRHADGQVGTTLLLDTGVAALLGDRAIDLAAASGVGLPLDRGPAADVHALGALLLRLLTASAPAGTALAALPPDLRSLLSELLHEDPALRPTAASVALRLAGLREGLVATGPVLLPRVAPRPVVPAPVHAPVTEESPIVAPRVLPEPAASLWTGATPTQRARSARQRVRIALLVTGGVGVAAVLVGVFASLPVPQEAGALVAAGQNGAVGARGATTAAAPSVPITTTASSTTAQATTPAPTDPATPPFVQPTALVPSPLAASTAPAPSAPAGSPHGGTGATTTTTMPTSTTPTSSAPPWTVPVDPVVPPSVPVVSTAEPTVVPTTEPVSPTPEPTLLPEPTPVPDSSTPVPTETTTPEPSDSPSDAATPSETPTDGVATPDPSPSTSTDPPTAG